MLQTISRALGHGLLTVGRWALLLLWEVVSAPFRPAARGLRRLWRRSAPWFAGGAALWGLAAYEPQLFGALLQYALAVGIMVMGYRLMFRGLRGGRRWGGVERRRRR